GDVAARTHLGERGAEVDVGEQGYEVAVGARGARVARLEVEGAGQIPGLEAVHDADRHAGGQERERCAEGLAVERARAGGARAGALEGARAVAPAEAVAQLRAVDDREVVRRAGPAVVEVAARRRHRQRDLVRLPGRPIRTSTGRGAAHTLYAELVHEAARGLHDQRDRRGRLELLERLARVLRYPFEREAHGAGETAARRGDGRRVKAAQEILLGDGRIEGQRAQRARRTACGGLTDAHVEVDDADAVGDAVGV